MKPKIFLSLVALLPLLFMNAYSRANEMVYCTDATKNSYDKLYFRPYELEH